GYIPAEAASPGGFVMKKKRFLEACNNAFHDPSNLHVLVIDEFNRGDPSRIFGEILTYIERRGEFFEIPNLRQKVCVHQNLVILATMNPMDKSIADLDQAMDRRFEKIEMVPRRDLLRRILVDINHMDLRHAGRVIALFQPL